jgi:hypothetical protein
VCLWFLGIDINITAFSRLPSQHCGQFTAPLKICHVYYDIVFCVFVLWNLERYIFLEKILLYNMGSRPPAGSEKVVLMFRSVNNIDFRLIWYIAITVWIYFYEEYSSYCFIHHAYGSIHRATNKTNL